VPGESVQEVPMPQVREVPTRLGQGGSHATLLQDAHTREEPGADGALLGAVNVEVDGAATRPRDDDGSAP
jgi:hypothetical protein